MTEKTIAEIQSEYSARGVALQRRHHERTAELAARTTPSCPPGSGYVSKNSEALWRTFLLRNPLT